MLASFKLELFENTSRYQGYMGRDKSKPWVARLLGLDDVYGFKREFMHGHRDYSRATRSRGVYEYFALEPGIYEVNERISWKHTRRYFIMVTDDAEIRHIDRAEVIQWLANDT